VKVKKEVKCRHKIIKCTCQLCGETLITGKIKAKKGNWVNGECIDKIKFPCFCSFIHGDRRCYGEINKSYVNGSIVYEVSDITRQINGEPGQMFSVIYTSDTLVNLIKYHDIHIKHGKIIIFDEEK